MKLKNNKSRGFMTALALSILFSISSLSLQIINLSMKPLVDAGVCTYTSAATMYSWLTVGSLAATFLGPIMVKKPKLIGSITAILYVVAGAIFGYVPNIYALWLASFLLGVCCVTNGYMPMGIIINQWFRKGAGSVITFGSSLHSILIAAFTPVIGVLFATSDVFGKSVMAVAGTLGVIALALSMCISKPPEAYGMEPVDLKLESKKKEKKAAVTDSNAADAIPVSRVMKTPYIYMAFLCQALIGAAATAYYSNSAFIFQDCMGIDTVQYSYIMSIYNIINMISIPAFGILSDTIGTRWAVPIYAGAAAISFVCFPLMHGFAGAVIGIVCLSFTQCGQWVGSFLLPKLFGVEKSPKLISWCSAFNCAVSICISPIFAALAQLNGGDYTLPVLVAGCGLAVAAVMVLLLTGKGVSGKIEKLNAEYANVEAAKQN